MNESIRKMLEPSGSAKRAKDILDSIGIDAEIQKAQRAMESFSLPKASTSHINLDPVRIPTQKEINSYQSASALMEALSKEALRWKIQLPENYKPAIIALLYGGLQINVHTLSQVSFHGIQIEGTLNGSPCSLLAHQSTIQMLCYAAEITEETPNRPIGFIWSGHNVEV